MDGNIPQKLEELWLFPPNHMEKRNTTGKSAKLTRQIEGCT